MSHADIWVQPALTGGQLHFQPPKFAPGHKKQTYTLRISV